MARRVVTSTASLLLMQALAGDAIGYDLTTDVTCTQERCFSLPGGSELRLNGYTVNVLPGGIGVACGDSAACTIIGPGTIRGGRYGAFGGKYRLENVTFTEHAYDAVVAHLVRATGVTIVNNGNGISIAGNTGPNPTSGGVRAIIRDSVISGNLGSGVFGNKRAVVHDSVISGNGTRGVWVASGRVKLVRAQIVDNGTDGVFAYGRIRATDSSVTGNGVDAACAVDTDCADLASATMPVLRDTGCGTSRMLDVGGTWGVCALD